MSDSDKDDRKKELRILLHQIQSRPSQNLTRVRERIVVLNNLIAGRGKSHA